MSVALGAGARTERHQVTKSIRDGKASHESVLVLTMRSFGRFWRPQDDRHTLLAPRDCRCGAGHATSESRGRAVGVVKFYDARRTVNSILISSLARTPALPGGLIPKSVSFTVESPV